MTAHRATARSTQRIGGDADFDLDEATRTIVATARHDPAGALARLNALVAAEAVRRLGGGADEGLSWWSTPASADLPPDALAAFLDGGRLLLTGRQALSGCGSADGLIAVLVRDRDGTRGGHLVLLDALHRQIGEPIFGRAGFHRDEIAFASPAAASRFTSLPQDRFEQTLAWTVLLEDYLHAVLDHGLLQGFWAAAQEHITTRTRPWQGQSLARATDDPHLVRRYGEYVALRHALDELMREARDAFLTAETRDDPQVEAEARIAVAAARQYAAHAGRTTISGTIELLGAGATSERFGFDLFWRDFTAHAVAHPPRWPVEAIGHTLLTSPPTEPLS